MAGLAARLPGRDNIRREKRTTFLRRVARLAWAVFAAQTLVSLGLNIGRLDLYVAAKPRVPGEIRTRRRRL